MEAAHQRLSNACVLVSKAAGTLEVACAEYEAAHLTLKRWWVRHVVSCISQFVLTLLELFPCLLGEKKNNRQLTDSAPAGSSGAERTEQSNDLSSLGGTAIDDVLEQVCNPSRF